MNTLRALLAVASGGAFGVGAGFLIWQLGAFQAGVAIAVSAALWIVKDCVRLVQRRRDRSRRRLLVNGRVVRARALPRRAS